MAKYAVQPTGVERTFGEEEIIVSKTDLKGRITYANDVFLRVAGFSERETIGAPHSFVRHPDMPRCVFKLLWDTIANGEEIFAYVINMAKNGDHYWVFAHVTPTFGPDGKVIGYHSNRRAPKAGQVDIVKPIYADLLAAENQYENRKEGMARAGEALFDLLKSKGARYDEFVFSF